MIRFVTDFADEAVVLPVTLTVAITLLALGWRRGAAAWSVGVAATLGATLALKLVTFACHGLLPWADLVSPSGHAAAAGATYGGLLVVAGPECLGGLAGAALAGGGMALLFGLTRLALHVHTVADVVVGMAVGLCGAAAIGWAAGPRPAGLRRSVLVGAALAVMLLAHGARLQAETRIRHAALWVWPLTLCAPQAGALTSPDAADRLGPAAR
jgi:membrane-associated phospholipid phosphatase